MSSIFDKNIWMREKTLDFSNYKVIAYISATIA
jgi:hypothetical protein